jgi:hypothetical protein
MVCKTRSKSRSAKKPTASAGYKYAIIFPEGQGYLYIQELPAGTNGAPQLLHSAATGKTCVRKATNHDFIDETGFPNEVKIGRSLANSGFVPLILEYNLVDDEKSLIVFEYCNGGDFDNYVKNKAHDEEDAEVLIWHVIARVVRIFTYLQTGWVGEGASMLEDFVEANWVCTWRPERYGKEENNNRMRNEAHVEPQQNNRGKVIKDKYLTQ